MQPYSIEYQSGRRYMVCRGQAVFKEGLESKEAAEAFIQRLYVEDRRLACTWIYKIGNC